MFGFFLTKPLWMKAAMLAGAGVASYTGYQYLSGPSGGGHHHRGHGHGHRGAGGAPPADITAGMSPEQALAPAPEHEAADAQAVQVLQATEVVQAAPDFVEWDEQAGWVTLPEHVWHQRFGDYVSRTGRIPQHMARPVAPAAHVAAPRGILAKNAHVQIRH